MRIVIRGRDGSVAIMTLAEGADKEDALKKFKDQHPGMYDDHFEVDAVPLDREFRDAWTCNGKSIVVDKAKASTIHLDRVRNARNKALDALDKEQLRHLSDAEKLKELESKKQILRDLPANVKGLEWPNILDKEK